MFKTYLHVPTELYLEVQEYVSELSYWNFIHVSKQLSNAYGETSRSYSHSFADVEVEKEEWPLKLSTYPPSVLNITPCRCGAELPVVKPKYLYATEKEETPTLTGGWWWWKNMRYLRFKENKHVTHFERLLLIGALQLTSFVALNDLSILSSLRELELVDCSAVYEVSCLGNLTKLVIDKCPLVIDVSQLGSVPDLSLLHCQSLEDISQLKNNHRLTIKNCPKIKHYSVFQYPSHLATNIIENDNSVNPMNKLFTRAKTLRLESYLGESLQLKHCRFLYELSLVDCGIKDFTSFSQPPYSRRHLHKITVINCQNIISLAGLSFIPVIKIFYCENLVDISDLGRGCKKKSRVFNLSVTINGCHRITDFSGLRDIRKINISYCDGFPVDAKDLGKVEILSISNCYQLKEFRLPSNQLKSLELCRCQSLTKIKGLWKVREVKIVKCPGLKSLKGLFKSDTSTTFLEAEEREKWEEFDDNDGSHNEKIVLSPRLYEKLYFQEKVDLLNIYQLDGITDEHCDRFPEEVILLKRKKS
jgi:hypothetical protein